MKLQVMKNMDDTVSRFINNMRKLNPKEYMFRIITYEIAPTLCGKKSASLITLTKSNRGMYNMWIKHKEEFLQNIPLNYFELNSTTEVITILLYNPNKLKELIQDRECIDFLKSYGYSRNITVHNCLCKLRERFDKCFPHEIGLFLDIPLEDVKGFIRNSGREYIHCGYWKVYSDVEETLKIFEDYSGIKKKVIELASMDTNFVDIIKFLSNYRDTWNYSSQQYIDLKSLLLYNQYNSSGGELWIE